MFSTLTGIAFSKGIEDYISSQKSIHHQIRFRHRLLLLGTVLSSRAILLEKRVCVDGNVKDDGLGFPPLADHVYNSQYNEARTASGSQQAIAEGLQEGIVLDRLLQTRKDLGFADVIVLVFRTRFIGIRYRFFHFHSNYIVQIVHCQRVEGHTEHVR